MAEDLICVFEHVKVLNVRCDASNPNGLLNRLSCAKVTGACAGGEYEDTSQHGAPPVSLLGMIDVRSNFKCDLRTSSTGGIVRARIC